MSFKENNKIINSIDLNNVQDSISLNGSSLKQLNLSTSGNVVNLNCSYNETGINYWWKITSQKEEIRQFPKKCKCCTCTYYNNILGYIEREYKTTDVQASLSYPVEGYDLHLWK